MAGFEEPGRRREGGLRREDRAAASKGDELPPGVFKMVKVYVAIKRKLSVGDKMAGPPRQQGRHLADPRRRGHAVPGGRDAGRRGAEPAGRAVAHEHGADARDASRVGRTRPRTPDRRARGEGGGPGTCCARSSRRSTTTRCLSRSSSTAPPTKTVRSIWAEHPARHPRRVAGVRRREAKPEIKSDAHPGEARDLGPDDPCSMVGAASPSTRT